MSVQTKTPEATRSTIPGWGKATVVLAVGVAVVFAWWIGHQLTILPPLPARLQADAVTGFVSVLADLVARLSGVWTLGSVLAIILFTAPGPEMTLTEPGRRLARQAMRGAQLWFWSSLLLTFANTAFVNGVPMGYTFRPDAWLYFQLASPSGIAWAFSAIVAAGIAVLGLVGRFYAAFAIVYVLGLLAETFVATTGNVTVGVHHDWATDAAVAVSFAIIPLATAAVAVFLRGTAEGADATASRVRRYHLLVLPLVAVAAVFHLLIAWQELAGESPFATFFGIPTVGFFVCFAILIVLWAVRQVTGRLTWAFVVPDVVVFVAYLALRSAANHVAPPRFLDPDNFLTQINYLGYLVEIPATAARLFGFGRPNLLWVLLTVFAMVAYLVGVAKIHRRGGKWPIGRTLPWFGGWFVVGFIAVTGFWEYSTAVYSWHMVVHMTVNMLVPALCVLGAPFTLLQTASAKRDAEGQLPGLRELSLAVEEYRPFQLAMSPPVLWLNYVASLFVVYFTPIFPWLMKYHWAHQLMLVYFMVTGYLFFNLVIGHDRQSWNMPHLVKLALMISIMPFHAIFAVGILSSQTIIGETFYRTLDVTWVGDLMADQSVAGQAAWLLGEIPLFVAVIALSVQWFQQDKVDARSFDDAQGTSDDPVDAYNEMLAQLAARDRELEQERIRRDLGLKS